MDADQENNVFALERPDDVWKLLAGKRVLHVKGFGSGFEDSIRHNISILPASPVLRANSVAAA